MYQPCQALEEDIPIMFNEAETEESNKVFARVEERTETENPRDFRFSAQSSPRPSASPPIP
ncbi:hypothetical protein APTSU1_000926700 [Apodemus speciosus]|uniref:Uncharacterized protein n=1 Tax=Apodemus speciosus TaxID=105296 RepID=A0ABQ0F428_APOSI